jgi:RNA polymerase sigma-70 factor (ECF subfamily)
MTYSVPLDELDLVTRLQAGEPEAFEILLRAQAGGLLRCARRLLGNEEDAREAVQDGFLQAARAIASFQGQSRLTTWLHRIVINAALMKRRARACRPQVAIEDLLPCFNEDGHHLEMPDPWPVDIDAELQRKETAQIVRAAIDQLPESYRTVVVLRDLEQLDTAETAATLGITENAVKIRLHRARQALRTLLTPHFKDCRDLPRVR